MSAFPASDAVWKDRYAAIRTQVPPANPGELIRMRLVELLNDGVSRRLTLVTAPRGNGKTTAVAHWANQSRHPVAWLSIEPLHNDPSYFLEHLIAAFQRVHPAIGRDVFPTLQSDASAAIDAILMRMIDEMGMVLNDFVLVLDDVHLLRARPVQQILAFLLTHQPPRLRMVLIGESDPPLKVAELRSGDQLSELRGPHLNTTMDEGTALLNDVLELKLPYGEVSAVVAGSKAFPARVRVAGLALRGYPEMTELVEDIERNDEQGFAPLVDRILDNCTPEQSEFLLRAALVDRLNPSLAQALTGRETPGEILESLAATGVVMTRLDRDGHWYAVPPVLRAVLLDALRARSDGNLRELHLRACLWYVQHGIVERAVAHAREAGDLELAAQLIEENAQAMLQAGRLYTFEQWLAAMPDALCDSRPRLAICHAWVGVIQRRFPTVHPYLEKAEQAAHLGDDPETIREDVDAIRAFLADQR